MIPFTKTATTISVVIDYAPNVIPSSHPNFEQICKLVRDPKTTEKQLVPLLDIPKAIETFTGGNVTVVNGRLFYKGYEVRSSLATLILKMVKAGKAEAAKPFELFLENAYENPDPRAAQDLYDWVAASQLPITPDGHILAWKAVGADFMSIHSGKKGRLDHNIGKVVEQDRHECDSDPNRTCSTGIHFCSADYLRHYASGGSRVVAVKINPRDVVAFPKDYGNSKGRCARLEVMGEVSPDRVKEFYPQARAVYNGWSAPIAKAKPAATITGCGSTATKNVKVGDEVRRRDGKTMRITSINTGNSTYPIRASLGNSRLMFTKKGEYRQGQRNPLDLML